MTAMSYPQDNISQQPPSPSISFILLVPSFTMFQEPLGGGGGGGYLQDSLKKKMTF